MADLSVTVQVDEIATEGENQFGIKVSANVRRGKELGFGEIEFFVAGHLTPNSPQPLDNGRASDDVSITTTAKSISVEARLKNTPYRCVKTNILLPREPKKPPAKPRTLYTKAVGKDGKYELEISVTDENGQPAKGACVSIMKEGDQAHPIIHADTDVCGKITVPESTIEFNDEEIEVFVKVLGTDIPEETLTLYGPPKMPKPPEIPEPNPDDLKGSYKDIMGRAWDRGTDDMTKGRKK